MLWDIVLFRTSDVKGVSNIKYRITHMLCPTLYAAITTRNAVLYFKKMRIAAYQVRFLSNKVEGFTISRSLRVFYN